MRLTRGSVIGYDTNRMMFEFTMLTQDASIVVCQISSVAMDQMDRGRGTLPSEREAQFIRLRYAIEKIVSDNFEEAGSEPGAVVRIFEKHLPETRVRKARG
jgi:hypothetical protein